MEKNFSVGTEQELFDTLLSKNPGLNEVQVELLHDLCRILAYMRTAELTAGYLKFSTEARLLSGRLGLLDRLEDDDESDMTTMLQGMNRAKTE